MQLYTKGKNSLYWSRIDKLNQYVHNKDYNVVPYMPDVDFLFVDFYPLMYPAPGTVQVYVNDVYLQDCTVIDILGTIYFTKKFDYGVTKITVKDGATELGTGEFVAINEYLYYELQSSDELDRLVEKLRVKNDLYFDNVRDENLYNNFGSILKTSKPNDFSYVEYRDMLDSFRDAYIEGSTVSGIKTAVRDITGVDPTFLQQGTGWFIRRFSQYKSIPVTPPTPVWHKRASIKESIIRYQSSLAPLKDSFEYNYAALDTENTPISFYYLSSSKINFAYTTNFTFTATKEITWANPSTPAIPANGLYYFLEYTTEDITTQEHKYARAYSDTTTKTRATPVIRMYSGQQNNFTIKLQVNNSKRTVTDETVIKNLALGGTDLLQSKNLTATIVLISGYTEGAEFTVDRYNGTITWLGGSQPAAGASYLVTYEYYVKEEVESIVEKVKPAHIRIKYTYV